MVSGYMAVTRGYERLQEVIRGYVRGYTLTNYSVHAQPLGVSARLVLHLPISPEL